MARPPQKKMVIAFWAAVFASMTLSIIPFGDYVLYPFAILSTWVHEMGHGLTAELVGGNFSHLEIYSNLGGVAFSMRPDGALPSALIAAGGLLGPAIAGGAVILLGSRPKAARWILDALGAMLLLSALLWVRNPFGLGAVIALGAAAILIGQLAPESIETAIAQFVGIRFCLESVSDFDYMFTKNFERGGQVMNSDSQAIAEVLFLPYWFWGGLIAAMSLAILGLAFYFAWVRPYRNQKAAA